MDLSKHLEKAAEAVKRRNYPFAIGLYHQLLDIQPDEGRAREGLRRALFKKAEAKPPSKFFAMLSGGPSLLIGSLLALLGRHQSAARSYERYLSHDPLNEGINLKLAVALEKAGCQKSALAVYRCYAEQEPRCLQASRSAGALLYEQGELDGALEMYEQALKISPRDQESLKARKNLAAEGALRSTGIEKAKSSREMIKDKEEQRVLERSDRLQLSAEEIEAELEELEAKLAEDTDNLRLLQRLADLHLMREDRRSAQDCLGRALQLDPSNSDLQARVGDLGLEMQEQLVRDAEARGDSGAAERARKVLQEDQLREYGRRVEQNPSDLALRFQYGSALLAGGQHDAAIAELQQSVKDPRSQVESNLLLGRAFRAKGLGELATGQLEKGLENAVGRGALQKEIRYELGLVAEEMGDSAAALKHFSGILEQDIGFRDVAQKVEQLQSSQG
ncbi:MAG: tetratricopeptide repeat protein [Planctomycetota bacterium]|jgi:tetratricopeptide (TPR) repeat protein